MSSQATITDTPATLATLAVVSTTTLTRAARKERSAAVQAEASRGPEVPTTGSRPRSSKPIKEGVTTTGEKDDEGFEIYRNSAGERVDRYTGEVWLSKQAWAAKLAAEKPAADQAAADKLARQLKREKYCADYDLDPYSPAEMCLVKRINDALAKNRKPEDEKFFMSVHFLRVCLKSDLKVEQLEKPLPAEIFARCSAIVKAEQKAGARRVAAKSSTAPAPEAAARAALAPKAAARAAPAPEAAAQAAPATKEVSLDAGVVFAPPTSVLARLTAERDARQAAAATLAVKIYQDGFTAGLAAANLLAK